MYLKTILIVSTSIFYVFGICANLYNHTEAFALFCAFCAILMSFIKIIKPKHAVLLFLIFCTGFYNTKYNIKDYDSFSNIRINNIYCEGRVLSIAQISKEGTRAKFYLDVENVIFKNKKYNLRNTKTLVTINDLNKSFKDIQIGDKIGITGNLRPPKSATNPSQFDYAKYLKYKDTFSILYVEGKNYKILSKADSYKTLDDFWRYLLQKTDNTRKDIINKHSKYIKSPQIEILGGIVFGNEAINPPDEIKQSFVNSGLLHLLAASGLNVALIFGIWWFLAQNIFRLPYVISIWCGIFFVILYTISTGFPPPVIRAAIMLFFVLLGKLIDRESKPVALIFFVGFVMLLFNPKMFCDVGFQLSFIVTIGLIVTIEPICNKLNTKNRQYIAKIKDYPRYAKIILMTFSPKFLLAAILVPICAQLYVSPLQMYYFNTFTPLSLFANLCTIPFIGAVSFLGFISSILGTIPYFGDKIIVIFDIIINPFLVLLVKISQFFSNFKNSIITTPSPSVFQMILFWILLILLVENIKENFKNKKAAISLICTLILFFGTFIQIPANDFEILTFDVGNADSILLKTPKGKYILIDTAMAPYRGISNAKTIMEEYFKDKNIKELEILIITHFDIDHCGGAKDILNDLKVKNVYVQNLNPVEQKGIEIINILKKKNIKYAAAKNNETIYTEGDFYIKTFCANINSPLPKDRKDNENSIITLVGSKNANALFMGDSGILAFSKIENYINQIDILKVGHHGAKDTINENIIKKIKPKYAIISSGYNIYGHPNPTTLEILSKYKVNTYSTKDLGAIKITKCKNHACKVENFDQKLKDFGSPD